MLRAVLRGPASFITSITVTAPLEEYMFSVSCMGPQGGPEVGNYPRQDIVLQIARGPASMGDFSLDFVPLSIVYCPPGQDMTNSLTLSNSFGTQLGIGGGASVTSDTGGSLKFATGFFGIGIGGTDSNSSGNKTSTGLGVSHFRTSVITADNQRAIGRAYWGPLGDLFVILVNPAFSLSKRADETIFYTLKAVPQSIIIPAWKLLRPGNDVVAAAIPADARRSILALDPFITNLDKFFPDSGAPLEEAANPYADPSPNNRAELIGRWWLEGGAEFQYSEGEKVDLLFNKTNEVGYTSTASVSASGGYSAGELKAALGVDIDNKLNITYQSSMEADASASVSASCFLIRNQNQRDTDAIEVYYDKIFSTFMFRRIRMASQLQASGNLGAGAIVGTVTGVSGAFLRGVPILLSGKDAHYQTSADGSGAFAFYNVVPGSYSITAGDHKVRVSVNVAHNPVNPIRIALTGVRRFLDPARAPVWEVSESLGVSVQEVFALGPQLLEATSDDSLARLLFRGSFIPPNWRKNVFFPWDDQPGPTSSGDSNRGEYAGDQSPGS